MNQKPALNTLTHIAPAPADHNGQTPYTYVNESVTRMLPSDIHVVEHVSEAAREAFEREWMRLTGDFRLGIAPLSYP